MKTLLSTLVLFVYIASFLSGCPAQDQNPLTIGSRQHQQQQENVE